MLYKSKVMLETTHVCLHQSLMLQPLTYSDLYWGLHWPWPLFTFTWANWQTLVWTIKGGSTMVNIMQNHFMFHAKSIQSSAGFIIIIIIMKPAEDWTDFAWNETLHWSLLLPIMIAVNSNKTQEPLSRELTSLLRGGLFLIFWNGTKSSPVPNS